MRLSDAEWDDGGYGLVMIRTSAHVLVAGGLLHFAVANTVLAQEAPEISTVRQAAIEIMQDKLGRMRGSIKPKEEDIFVTEKMVNRFKPLSKEEREAAEEAEKQSAINAANAAELDTALAERERNSDQTTPVEDPELKRRDERIERRLSTIANANAARSERLQREIFRAIRAKMPKQGVDDELVTNSITSGTLPDTSDMKVLLDAVEQMIATQSY